LRVRGGVPALSAPLIGLISGVPHGSCSLVAQGMLGFGREAMLASAERLCAMVNSDGLWAEAAGAVVARRLVLEGHAGHGSAPISTPAARRHALPRVGSHSTTRGAQGGAARSSRWSLPSRGSAQTSLATQRRKSSSTGAATDRDRRPLLTDSAAPCGQTGTPARRIRTEREPTEDGVGSADEQPAQVLVASW